MTSTGKSTVSGATSARSRITRVAASRSILRATLGCTDSAARWARCATVMIDCRRRTIACFRLDRLIPATSTTGAVRASHHRIQPKFAHRLAMIVTSRIVPMNV